jgi:hypothetical protein
MIAALVLAVVAYFVQRHLRPHVILATEELVKIEVPDQGILTIDQSGPPVSLAWDWGTTRKTVNKCGDEPVAQEPRNTAVHSIDRFFSWAGRAERN